MIKKISKIIPVLFLTLSISLLGLNSKAGAVALENNYRPQKVNSLSGIAQELTTRKSYYLNKNKVNKISELPKEELNKLLLESQKIKKVNNDIYQSIISKNSRASTPFSNWDWTGKIFVTMDSRFLIFNHGHAGIASSTVNDTIEANPGDGVKKYRGSNYGYWDKKRCRTKHHGIPGGVYGVLDSNWNQHLAAANFANEKIGTGYGLWNDGDSTFYCSELVFRAWQQAGKTISYSNPLWGYLVLPADIMLSPTTYLVQDWLSWSNPSYPNGSACPDAN